MRLPRFSSLHPTLAIFSSNSKTHLHKILIACCFLPLLHESALAEVEYIVTPASAPLNLPFSDAVRVDNMLFISGTLGVEPTTFTLVEGGIEAETHQIFSNLTSLLKANDATLADVVKCTVMIADIALWPAFNTIYLSYFTDNKPARSALGANGLALGAAVELECWAVLPEN